MSQKTPKRVALLLGQDIGYSRRVLSGILSMAESKKLGWIFHNAPPDLRVLPALERWKPHGIITHLADHSLAERLLELSIPTISVTNTLPGLPIPFVDVDSFEVGRMAAEYFQGVGLRSFAYYGSRYAVFSQNRQQGFKDGLASSNLPYASLHADFLPYPPFSQDWTRMDRRTGNWLRQLPKPVGILASNDLPARSLTEICRSLGFQVPSSVAILGVDNDTAECRMSVPSLSSIDIPAEAIGRTAIELLEHLLSGKHITQETYLPPLGVIVRPSTELKATWDPLLRRAVDYIEENASKEISVIDVCRHTGQSRRSLERQFKDNLQSTILNQIQLTRVSHAKQLLLQTDLSISTIAERSGFGSLRRLNRIFRANEQCSPSDWRKLR